MHVENHATQIPVVLNVQNTGRGWSEKDFGIGNNIAGQIKDGKKSQSEGGREMSGMPERCKKCELVGSIGCIACAKNFELSSLREELEKAKEENRYLLVEAKAELEWFQRSWCDDHPMSEGGINRVHRLISRIDVALKEAGK